MIKLRKLILVLTFIVCLTVYPEKSFAIDIKQCANGEISKLDENSKEKMYEDVILSLLVPYMQKEINNYYKEYLTDLPTIAPYTVDIVNVKRISGYRIQLEVIAHPYVGPHDTVGDDRMIIETGAFGSVEIKNFEHIKSYELPWNWKHIIKKAY